MSYASTNVGVNQNKQLMTMAIVLFLTIVAAITFSAILVSSIVKGEVAKALSNSAPVATTQSINAPVTPAMVAVSAPACTPPTASLGGGAPAGGSGVMPAMHAWGYLPSISGSFNNSNTSTTNTSNTFNKTINKTKTTTITDSFKVASDNNIALIMGNTVASNNDSNNTSDSNNTVASNNKLTATQTTNTTTNNTDNSTTNTATNSNVNSTVIEDNNVAMAAALAAAVIVD